MKALTNILSHLLMLLMLFIVACTEETVEVDNLMRQEQYVTVRINIPGMTATATRADDGVIESITALAFDDADKLLEIETITTVTNTNEYDGFNGTFNLTVPNGTTTIHFLANLPDDYNLTNDYKLTDVKKESDLTKLSIGDWQTLRYWGMATYDGSNSTLSTTLYRNLAKISIKPSETDPEFNQFTQDQLKMTGFYMPNERGALIPNNNGAFDFDMNSNYCTIPQDVSSANYQLWDFTSMYAFEHENTDSNPTYIICKIGDYHYKVALADNEGNRYPIIRNHEYIIYVSDVDDYSHDDNYRADAYDKAFDKLPINLDVQQEVIETVELGISAATASLYYDSDNTEQITVTVPVGKTLTELTITPSVDCFTITPASGELTGPVEGNKYTYAPNSGVTGSVTFTIAPKSGYDFTNVSSSTLTFGGTGVDMNVATAQTAVGLTKKPEEVVFAVNPTNATINMDNGYSSTTLTLTKPSTMKKLRIRMSDTDAFNISGNNLYPWYENSDYCLDGIESESLEFSITVKDGFSTEGQYTITFFDYTNESTFVQATITIVNTSVEEPEVSQMSVTPDAATINMDANPAVTSATLTLTKPANMQNVKVSITYGNDVSANSLFNIRIDNNNDLGQNNDIFNDINSSNTSVQVALSVKDNTIPSGSYTVRFADSNNQSTYVDATITVQNTPAQGEEVVIWTPKEGSAGIEFGTYLQQKLLSGIYATGDGLVEIHRTLFVKGAEIIVQFIAGNGAELDLSTNCATIYDNIADGKMSYIFKDEDFSSDGEYPDKNIYGHGLFLIGENVTVTQISIKPAPTP